MLHHDEIDKDGFEVLNDSSYLTQLIGFTFILECLAGLIWIIRKVVKH
jgi:hypothetical protein